MREGFNGERAQHSQKSQAVASGFPREHFCDVQPAFVLIVR